MKKYLLTSIVAFSLVFCLGLVGCGSGEATETDAADEPAKSVEKEEAAAEAQYAVTIDSARTAADYEGNPVLIVTFSWVNNSEETTSYAVACINHAFQDGVQLEPAFVTDLDDAGYMAEVRPGAGTTFERAYKTTSTSEVEVEVSELISFSDDVLAHEVFAIE